MHLSLASGIASVPIIFIHTYMDICIEEELHNHRQLVPLFCSYSCESLLLHTIPLLSLVALLHWLVSWSVKRDSGRMKEFTMIAKTGRCTKKSRLQGRAEESV